MRILTIIILGLVLFVSCNSKDKNKEKTIDDTLRTGTDTSQIIENGQQQVTDTSKPSMDEPATDDSPETSPATSVKWSKLVAGGQSRMEKRSMLIINNRTKFDELWKIAFDNDLAPAKPTVDFSKNSVVALFLGEVTSGGHSIEVSSVKTSAANGYEVSVVHTKPGSGCMSATVMEYPYFLALTDKLKSDKADFKTATKETKCN